MATRPASTPTDSPILPTSRDRVNEQLTRLTAHKTRWLALSLAERLDYLQRCLQRVVAIAPDWAERACLAKGIAPTSDLAGEEWLIGPVSVVANLRLLIQALKAGGSPSPVQVQARSEQQLIAQVFPGTWMDRLLCLGFHGEVWIEPGKPASQGQFYRQPPDQGRLALILGAGNVSSIACMDALYQLFVKGEVVVLKMNPVNEYLGPLLEQALAPLITDGFLAIVYGDAALGQYLCHHPAVDTIHMTGSHHTHDAIIWGPPSEEQQRRKDSQEPLLQKPITSELGGITPILVVPGDWTEAELAFQARHVASMVAHNASFNCVAGKVLVLADGWPQRAQFLAELRQALSQIPARLAYYPGAQNRYQAFLDRYPQAEAFGERTDRIIPWTLIPDVPPIAGEYALSTEAFCGILAEVSLPATHAADFLTAVVPFANQAIWGNLGCAILIDPRTQKTVRDPLDQAIADLQYGSIGLNIWPGILYYLSVHAWGAFPNNPLHDIRSGRGFVHNAYLFDYPQKSVLRAPFQIWPTPSWFANRPGLLRLAQALLSYEANPSGWRCFQAAIAAVVG